MIIKKIFNSNEKIIKDLVRAKIIPTRQIHLYNGSIYETGLKEAVKEFPKDWIELKNGKYLSKASIESGYGTLQGKFLGSFLDEVPKIEVEMVSRDFYTPEDRRKGFEFEKDKKGYICMGNEILKLDLMNKKVSLSRKLN